MATKTSSKTATGKPAPKPFGTGRRTTAPEKPAGAEPKTKLPKKGLETVPAPADAAARAKSRAIEPEQTEAQVSAHPSSHPESISLIDRKRPGRKSQDGEAKPKRTV